MIESVSQNILEITVLSIDPPGASLDYYFIYLTIVNSIYLPVTLYYEEGDDDYYKEPDKDWEKNTKKYNKENSNFDP